MPETIKDNMSSIPVMIITGFLGSGKTSFLSTLVKLEELSNSAIIINEFGEIGLDHLLVEYTDNPIFELPNGCLCCNARGELIEKMLQLAQRWKHRCSEFDRLIIETSGVADTTNLIASLWNNSMIRNKFRLSKIVTVVSALEWPASQSGFREADSQLAISDAIIISKSDLLPASTRDQQLAHLKTGIEMINNRVNCHILPLEREQLIRVISNSGSHSYQDSQSLEQHHNTGEYKTCTLLYTEPVSTSTIEIFMDILLIRHAGKLLRVKGLVLTLENPARPLVIQAVKSTLSPLSWLRDWNIQPQTQLTIIHTGKSNELFTELFKSILDIPSIDQPDKSALSDNPLSIPGHGIFKP